MILERVVMLVHLTFFLSHGTDGAVGLLTWNAYDVIIHLEPLLRDQQSKPVGHDYFRSKSHSHFFFRQKNPLPPSFADGRSLLTRFLPLSHRWENARMICTAKKVVSMMLKMPILTFLLSTLYH